MHERIRELEEHHTARMEEMLTGMNGEAKTAYEVAGHVTWVTGDFASFTPWMKRAAIGETLAHLEHMVMEGIVERLFEGGKQLYRPVRTGAR